MSNFTDYFPISGAPISASYAVSSSYAVKAGSVDGQPVTLAGVDTGNITKYNIVIEPAGTFTGTRDANTIYFKL